MRYIQPQQPTQLDSGNPLTKGLKYFWYAPARTQMLEAAKNSHGAFGTANTIQAIPAGTAAVGGGDPASNIDVSGCDPDDYGNFTVFARIYAPNLLSRTQFVMGTAYNGGLAFLVDGSGYLQIGQSYQVMAAVSSLAISTGEFADVMASWDGTTTRYWVNGVNAGTDTTAIGIGARASLKLLGQEDGLCFASGSMMQYAGIYNRAITSDTEALAIARNPWQLLKPHGRILKPAVTGAQTLTQSSRFDNTNTFYSATVAPGAVGLAPSLFSNSNTFYSATVSQSGSTQDLTPTLFSNSNTFYNATVIPGAVNLTPALFTNTPVFYSATVSEGAAPQDLTPLLFSNSNAFYTATVAPGTVNLAPTLLANLNTFYAAILTGGDIAVTPSLRTLTIAAETRTLTIAAETRTLNLEA